MFDDLTRISDALTEVYTDLHAHPELSYQEHRTAGIVAERLTALGVEVIAGIGTTGVVGLVRNGEGPTVLLRADMDALPVAEETGLPYASTARAVDKDGNEVPVMHACGHDMHVACLLGATEVLLANLESWSGTLEVVFQPAEEHGSGAQAMVNDGIYERIPKPDVVLGQHVAPAASGLVGAHPGPAFAAADGLEVHMFGRGGHGSRPEATIDPVVMGAATVARLQTIVSREVAASETAVVTVGTFHAGTKNNIIADEVVLGISARTTDPVVRGRVLEAIDRIVRAEARAAGAEREPTIVSTESFPPLINDEAATARVIAAFRSEFGAQRVIDPGAVTGSEDVGVFADASGAPLVYWLLGGADPEAFAAAAAAGTIEHDIPSNHSSHFAPVIRPTLDTGITALTVAALEWLQV